MVKIATWNLERGGKTAQARGAQEVVLRDLTADILILTEPGPLYRCAPGVVTSPPNRSNAMAQEPWVAIVGSSVEPVPLDVPFERMAVAAKATVNNVDVLVYGSVLPWAFVGRDAPELVHAGETALDSFLRLLHEQAADVEALGRQFPHHVLVWSGDFNQTVSGPNRGGSVAKREALLRTLDDLGLVAWNGAVQHAIDLICGPRDIRIERRGWIDPQRDGVKMSDHAGHWVELSLARCCDEVSAAQGSFSQPR